MQAGDGPGIAFNAQAVTVAAPIEALEQLLPRRTDRDARLLSTPT
jgi:hypothetical protein